MKVKDKIIIAIDGPAGSGKTTVAKQVAQRLKINYLDTGAMYRALSWFLLKSDIDYKKEDVVKSIINNIDLKVKFENSNNILIVNGEDVTDKIRSPEISQIASYISQYKDVREKLVKIQKELGNKYSLVAEGRDMTSVVFPETPYKFYLTASLKERAKRRYLELKKRGYKITQSEVEKELIHRDKQDSSRKYAPLVKTKDSIEIDTTNLNIEQVVDLIINHIKKIRNKK